MMTVEMILILFEIASVRNGNQGPKGKRNYWFTISKL